IGTVWLPLPHLIMTPLVGNDRLWQTGLAGAIPVAVCFVLAGTFLFASVKAAFESRCAAGAAAAFLVLNPNLLYLQATPMTEPIFLACLMALFYFTVRFRRTQSVWVVIGCGLAAFAGSLTRYEGWFLIPFVGLYVFAIAKSRAIRAALVFFALA